MSKTNIENIRTAAKLREEQGYRKETFLKEHGSEAVEGEHPLIDFQRREYDIDFNLVARYKTMLFTGEHSLFRDKMEERIAEQEFLKEKQLREDEEIYQNNEAAKKGIDSYWKGFQDDCDKRVIADIKEHPELYTIDALKERGYDIEEIESIQKIPKNC